MEAEIHIRNAGSRDIDGIMAVERTEYGSISWVAPAEVFMYRMVNCYLQSQGDLFWVAEENKRIVGYITGLIIHFDHSSPPCTRKAAIGYSTTDDGREYGFGTRHDPRGNSLYVMSIGTLERSRGIASRLIRTTLDFAGQNGLNRIAGLRSGYAQYKKQHPEITPETYTLLRRPDGQFVDGLMRLYSKLGFEELQLKENYAPEDIDGEGWGNLMIWRKSNA